MTFDKRYIYLFLVKRTLDNSKFINLSQEQRLAIVVLVLDNALFPEIQGYLHDCNDIEIKEDDDYGKSGARGEDRLTNLFIQRKDLFQGAITEIKKVDTELSDGYQDCELKKRLDYLKAIFSLSEIDIDAVLSLAILKQLKEKIVKVLPTLAEFYIDKSRYGEKIFQSDMVLSFMGEDSSSESLAMIEDSTLLSAGLIQNAYFDRFHIGENLYKYLLSDETKPSYLHTLETKSGPIFELDTFSISNEKTELIKRIIHAGNPISILIFGPPGAGKTEYVRSLGMELKKEVLFVPTSMPGRDKGLDKRKLSLSVASLTSNPRRQIVCIDESDELLGTKFDFMMAIRGEKNGNKEFINNLMDSSKSVLLFISNNLAIDDSTLRRFSLIIEFKEMGIDQRKEMVMNTFKSKEASDILCDEVIDKLVRSEKLSQGILGLALKDSLSSSDDPVIQKEIFQGLIDERLEFFYGKRNSKSIRLI